MSKRKKVMASTKELLDEAMHKHREIKRELLAILGKVDSPTVTKARLKDELFKLYIKIK